MSICRISATRSGSFAAAAAGLVLSLSAMTAAPVAAQEKPAPVSAAAAAAQNSAAASNGNVGAKTASVVAQAAHSGAKAAPALAISVTDDSAQQISLPAPARRIVSLAPHTAELLYAAGAGRSIIGVTDYSDFPAAARTIPSLGSASGFDVERIAALRPDLIVAWGSGNPASKLATLRALGFTVYESEPRQFETIATSLERLGRLAGTAGTGQAAAQNFRSRLDALRKNHQSLPSVSVFYQVWRSPLMTLNGAHLVSQAISLCGGANIFAGLGPLAPTVSMESVLSANPEVIVTGAGGQADPLAEWRRYSSLQAVRHNNLITLNSDTMTRAGPRILDGTEMLCRELALARSRRG